MPNDNKTISGTEKSIAYMLTYYDELSEGRGFKGDVSASGALMDLREAIAQADLTPKQTVVLKSVYVDNKPLTQVAAEQDTTIQSISKILRRAVARIARAYKGDII